MPRNNKKYKCKQPMFGKADKYVARQAFKMGAKALSMLNVEYKCHDVSFNNTAVTQTAIITQLTNVPQGDSSQSRDGSQLKITRNVLRYSICGGAVADTLVRCMLVHDKQTNGAIYAIADLLQDSSVIDIINSPLNLDNKYRFRVLYDKVHKLSNASQNAIAVSKVLNLSQRIRFDGTDTSITDLTSSSLSFVMCSNQGASPPNLALFNRLRFVDN